MARATLDIDLVADVRLEHADSLEQMLRPAFYVDAEMIRWAVRQRSSFNVIHLDTMLKVDVFAVKEGAFHGASFARNRDDVLAEGTRSFRLALPEDVILHKLLWFRAGGEVSDRQWQDVLGVLRVQAGQLDQAWLDRWAAELGVQDLLERARGAASG